MVHRCVIWMDDILVIAPNRKMLKTAIKRTTNYAMLYGLSIKPTWAIMELDRNPIDMMGFRIHRSARITMRGRNFIKARRMILRTKDGVALCQAVRLASYKGYFKHSNCYQAKIKYDTGNAFKRAEILISERSKNERGNRPRHE